MTVEEIVNLAVEFSVSGGNATAAQKAVFLQYLNLYKDYLYSKTAVLDSSRWVSAVIDVVNYNNAQGILLDSDTWVFAICSVNDLTNRTELKKRSQSEIYSPAAYREEPTQHAASYYVAVRINGEILETRVFLYPILAAHATIKLGITYINNPAILTMESKAVDIPFPAVYHQLLVDGTLWYVFQDAGGFKDNTKALEAKARCEKGEQRLISFLSNTFHDQSNAVAWGNI